MKIIAHRGNLDGPDSKKENHPDYIKNAIDLGFDVEIDIWLHNNDLYLGHCEPQYKIDISWLKTYKHLLWIHLKNIDAYNFFCLSSFNYFWHENDKFTLTSKNIPWCYPGVYLRNGITVHLGNEKVINQAYGICTDYARHFD